MSDDFIPLNQSTPTTGGKWQGGGRERPQNFGHNNRYHNQSGGGFGGPRRGHWRNNSSRNSSFGSDSNSSFGRDQNGIDAYLHPSMLQDPWEQLRRRMENSNKTSN